MKDLSESTPLLGEQPSVGHQSLNLQSNPSETHRRPHTWKLVTGGVVLWAAIAFGGYYARQKDDQYDLEISGASLFSALLGLKPMKNDALWTQAVSGLQLEGYPSPYLQLLYEEDLEKIDWSKVEKDLEDLMTDSQEWWPADYGNYGALFMRLSWHSCGSYRMSDGRGGCDGGGQRFDPERSWPDNTNLDKARRLLDPIKQKYGNGVSWGDLFALSGTVAIRKMGGPDIGFCAGRQDMIDNKQTMPLGPSREQKAFAQCPVQGQCPFPLGSNTLGLIYVNPEGPMGQPDPQGAADTIRDVFGRMDWKGCELVALIGGGHTFGKAHGASTASNGEPPNKCPFASWNGPKGVDAITSGFEGPWTSEPTKFDNNYFKYLIDFEWEPVKGPGGHYQWQVKGGDGPVAPSADPHSNATQPVMMLTTDIALSFDQEYRKCVEDFAEDEDAFAHAFAEAWYKLVTRDMGPRSRCLAHTGNTPQAKGFQNPLPKSPRKLANMNAVGEDLERVIKHNSGADFIRLAYQCASTYRATDYMGGCNGASIRFSPGIDWEANAGLNDIIALLDPVVDKYGDGLSYADAIVLAGNIALERAGGPSLKFCPGRTDAPDGEAWSGLAYGNEKPYSSVDEMIRRYQNRGQTAREFVALSFAKFLSTDMLKEAVDAENADGDILLEGLKYYPELKTWVDFYIAEGDKMYRADFKLAWTKLMNADRFDGPVRNKCSIYE